MTALAEVDTSYRQAPDALDLGHIPGNHGLPVLGETLAVLRDLHAVAVRHLREYGPVSRIRLAGQGGLLVMGAEHFERIFHDPEQCFSAEKGYDRQLGIFYPRGLLLMDFDEHRANRRMMQGAFKVPALQRYIAMMQPVIERHVREWGRDERIVFYPRIKQLLLEIGARCFLGIEDFEREAVMINDLFLDLNAGLVSVLRVELPFGAFGRAMRARRELERWCRTMIAERRRRGAAGEDVLSQLCLATDEEGQPYDVKSIVDHIIFLLFAAHDTSTSALSHLAMYVGRDAALQDRLREHLAPFGPGPLTHTDLSRMDFAQHCLYEAMRLHPPVPMAMRRTIRAIELDGLHIPAHTVLHLPMMMNQRDPRWWTEPDAFDPDRFASSRQEQKRHAMCFHPFGSGAHKCIGMFFAELMVKAFLWQFVRSYRFTVPAGYAPRMQWVPLPKPADGVPLRLQPA
ncbi:MAG: cytochrome P450 [Steroidobacteraceae bacterium]